MSEIEFSSRVKRGQVSDAKRQVEVIEFTVDLMKYFTSDSVVYESAFDDIGRDKNQTQTSS